jgi:predicted enzyme related to lactoylglutathione lyase
MGEMMVVRTTENNRPGNVVLLCILSCVVLISACATQQPVTSPIPSNPTGTYQVGKFVWFDLLTNDVPGTKRFYGELFNWEFEGTASDNSSYATIKNNDTAIGGIINLKRLDENVSESRWLSYLSVADVDRSVKQFREAEGTVLKEASDVPGRGRVAVVKGPQGAILALLRTKGGDPEDRALTTGAWMWTELWTSDVMASITFYKSLSGFTEETVDTSVGEEYHFLKQADQIRAGVVPIPWDDVKPNWLPYIAVSDISSTVARAEALGGKVLIDPGDSIDDDSIAVIADPSGAAFGIENLPAEK